MLADCLLHAQREGAERLIDVATLTGGVVVALGSVYAGLLATTTLSPAQLLACADRAASCSGACRCTRTTPRWSRVATPS